MKCVGHGGASRVIRGNTLASFEAAAELGADVIEFDVRPHGRELVVAHLGLALGMRRPLTLDRALDHLATPRFSDLELDVDVKTPGCEAAILEALRSRGLLDRSMITSQVPLVVDRVRALDGHARTGISVGGALARRSCRWADWRASVLAGLRAGRWHALMAQHKLVDAALVAAVGEAGGEVYAWTVNERSRIGELRALGVAGVTTGDPRLFG